jgi:hypothetical protein
MDRPNKHPYYEALSYVWGDPTALVSVLKKIHDHDAYRREQGRSDSLNHFWDELKMPFDNLEVWKPVRSFLDRPWYD